MSRRPVVHQPRPLDNLVPNSELLDFRNGKLVVLDRLETPVNEFGIPDATALIGAVLGSLALNRNIAWKGDYDVHHLAWPKRGYIEVNPERGPVTISRNYRESNQLKYRVPRQVHEYFHAVFEPPVPACNDVMLQLTKETRGVSRLHDATSQAAYYRSLDYVSRTVDPWLGVLPDLEYLATLDVHTARHFLGAIAMQRSLPRNLNRWYSQQISTPLEHVA